MAQQTRAHAVQLASPQQTPKCYTTQYKPLRVMPGARPRFVFACFKRIERCGDWVTGAAGPFFVAAATVLFILGTLCFRTSLIIFKPLIFLKTIHKSVDVILPTIPWPWLSVPPCILIIINLFAHYYFSCTVSPGFAGDPPQRVGHSFIWAKKRRAHGRTLSNGVYWSSHLNITPASSTKCPKCSETKTEVRQYAVISSYLHLLEMPRRGRTIVEC